MNLISFPAVTSAPAANGLIRLSRSQHAGVNAYQHPQLLYHLQVARGERLFPTTGTTFPTFPHAIPDWGPRLTHLYDRRDDSIQLIPRECSPHLSGPQACAANLSQISPAFNGRSWNLAGAIGLAAALCGVRVPAWVCSSGCLPSNHDFQPRLALAATGAYERKILLCSGRLPTEGAANCVQWLCQEPEVCDMHGARVHRGLPGQIRLLLLARWEPDGDDNNGLSREARHDLGLVLRPDLVAALATDGLNHVIDSLPADQMLVVQVTTVWHALALLGLLVPNFPPHIRITPADVTAFLVPRHAPAC